LATVELETRSRRNGQPLIDGVDPYAEEAVQHLRRLVDVGIALLAFALALSLRLPYLMEVPGFTDEGVEVQVGLEVLQGRWPLVDVEPYLGSLFNYITAGAFLLLGQHGYVPRLLVTLLSAATVVLTYFLALRLGGRLVALLAAGLMATSFVHIVTSHIAWTNCTTPFFTTAAMLALVWAVTRRNGPMLILAGFLYGLAIQTHPSVLFLAPAFALYYLFGSGDAGTRGRGEPSPRPSLAGRGSMSSPGIQRSALGTPWPYLALLAAILAYGNVILYNWQNPTAWTDAANRTDYAYVYNPTTDSYLVNLQFLGASLLRAMSGAFEGGPTLENQLGVPLNWPYIALLLIGTVCALRRLLGLPLLALALPVLVMPYFNKDYSFPIALRYAGYLLPLLHLLSALALAEVLTWCWRGFRKAVPFVGAVCLLLMALPTANLMGYYDGYLRDNATNPTILALQAEIRARHQAGMVSEVFLDQQLDWIFTAPGGRVLGSFEFLMRIEGVPHRRVWMAPDRLREEIGGLGRPVVLLLTPASRERLGSGFALTPMEVSPEPRLDRVRYWAYMLQPISRQQR